MRCAAVMPRVALLLATATVALAIAGCGDDERDQLEDYLNQANSIQEAHKDGFKQAKRAYTSFSGGELDSDKAPDKLEAAEDTIRAAQSELEGLSPPPIAERLHERLLKLYALYAEFAHETFLLAAYLPEAEKLSRQLARANRDLRGGLEVDAEAEGQARALAVYVKSVEKLVAGLKKLEAPVVLERAHRQRIKALVDVQPIALDLRAALREQDAGKVARLLLRFRESTAQQDVAGIDRDSLRAYNKRYQHLGRVEASVRQEEGELAAELASGEETAE